MSSEPDHWFESAADHLGAAYLRYSFTRGTEQEIDFLVDACGLAPGMRVLDVGCGPGRHAHALARRGMVVHGIDISARFIELARDGAPDGATFERVDARSMSFAGEFDAALSLCQGAFGLAGLPGPPVPSIDPDGEILEAMARALRQGGVVALSAFSSYYQVRALEDPAAFDADHGVNHEVAELRSETGTIIHHDLWTSCFTPRELRLMARLAGLEVDALWSVTPGRYAPRPPSLDEPEFLLVARRR
jgi:SAM-dependent methyltransferase